MGHVKAPDHQQNQAGAHPQNHQPLQKSQAQFKARAAGAEVALENVAALEPADGDNRRCGWCENARACGKKPEGRHGLQVQRLVRRRCRDLFGRREGKMTIQKRRRRKKRQKHDEGGRARENRNLQWPLLNWWPQICRRAIYRPD